MRLLKDLLKIFWLPGAFFFLNQIGLWTLAIYDKYPWFDIPAHFLGGLFVAYSYSVFLRMLEERRFAHMHRLIAILFVVAFVGLTAIVWEWHEFIRDFYFDSNTQMGEADTMSDFFFGLLGGLLGALFFITKNTREDG